MIHLASLHCVSHSAWSTSRRPHAVLLHPFLRKRAIHPQISRITRLKVCEPGTRKKNKNGEENSGTSPSECKVGNTFLIGYSIYAYLPPANQTTWLSPLSSASSTWLPGTIWPPMRRSRPATPPPQPSGTCRGGASGSSRTCARWCTSTCTRR